MVCVENLCHWSAMGGGALTLGLLVAVVQDDVGGVVHARGQVLHGPLAELVHPEDEVVHVGDTVDVVLKDVYAEGKVEVCGGWVGAGWGEREVELDGGGHRFFPS